jgi:hypothetical protein
LKTFKYRFEHWPQPLPGGYSLKDNEIGTIRTDPENYYVASVFLNLSIKFDPIEAATRDVDREGVTKWWNGGKGLNIERVTVRNLRTGAERVYVGFTPAQAVVAAYYQTETGNDNTWMYDWSKAKVTDSGKTVTCGEWTNSTAVSVRVNPSLLFIARWQVVGGTRSVVLYHDAPFQTIRNALDKGPYTQRTITDSYSYEEFTGSKSAGAAGTFSAPNDSAAIAHMEANFLKQFRSEYRSVKRVK